MKFKTLFVSILATLSLGLGACNVKDTSKPVDPPVSSEEPPVSEHEHAFGEWVTVTEPTCTEKGLEERTCECGEKEQHELDALGHLPGEWEITIEPTVDAEGQKVKKCQRCQEILETETIDKLEPPEPEKDVQIISFAATAGSGEHDAESLGALMAGDLVKAVSNVSKIYKSTGSSGAHPNMDGIIKTGTSKANGTFTIELTKPISKLTIDCHDFYAKSDAYPTNSNKIIINDVEKLAPYNEAGDAETLTWEFETPVEEINFSATRVYLWGMGLYE